MKKKWSLVLSEMWAQWLHMKDKWMDRPNILCNFRMSGNLNLMMEHFKPTGW